MCAVGGAVKRKRPLDPPSLDFSHKQSRRCDEEAAGAGARAWSAGGGAAVWKNERQNASAVRDPPTSRPWEAVGPLHDPKQAGSPAKGEQSEEIGGSGECLICMRDHTDPEIRLLSHNCATCTSGPAAWMACSDCDKKFRSQRCPVCRCDYAPSEFHRLIHPDDVEDVTLRAYIPLFAMALCESQRAILWSPSSNTLRFSLPVDPSIDTSQRQYEQAAMPASPEARAALLEMGTFNLANTVVRAIQASSAAGAAGEVRKGRLATEWLYSRGGELGNAELLLHARRVGGRGLPMGDGDFFLFEMTPEEQREKLERMASHVECLWSEEL
eukprot:CAMPEP_0174925344 /NCGR_PEP_ID=MMETSP1355-20121228/7844_1 /TAXON_ID=464990 /ORGANISM="Hemiselmis tepida, Strain CCMP443" /LENGTH=326 /DNA_ID=CAMNT_0016171247 /DNA_START=66 /DNA_END=1046 /DNA_ORIENTATION=-